MFSDPVVQALRAALTSGDSPALRIALGKRLYELGDAGEALRAFEEALQGAPSDAEALQGARNAAAAMGDTSREVAYHLALEALERGRAEEGASAETSPLAGSEGEEIHRPFAPGTSSAQFAPPAIRLVADGGELLEGECPAQPTTTLADVAGLEEVKTRLRRSFLLPMQQPELTRQFGKRIGGGLILYGPPGCGKTFLAKALAGELGLRFHSVALSDVLDMWFGESERKLHEIFEHARRSAPAVLFFDEIDGLGHKRSHLRATVGRTLVTQLLAEMDGVDGRNEGLLFLGATNHPWDVDPALRRPGRFDRLVFVPPPDAPARKAILQLGLRDRPVAPDLDLDPIVERTENFSGADLIALAESATEHALDDSLATGRTVPVDLAKLRTAREDRKPSTRAWLETARTHAVYASEGGSFDDLLAYLKARGLA